MLKKFMLKNITAKKLKKKIVWIILVLKIQNFSLRFGWVLL